jgi:hypothetical protein
MQTDWGGEYAKLNLFFKNTGISHHVSCPHAHQQNWSTERKHRHIVEVGLSLLAHASMPLKFWDEAFLIATYLINRTPSRVINYDTPLEPLFHIKPEYSSLRAFGCACWPNLRPYNTRKLGSVPKGVFSLAIEMSIKALSVLMLKREEFTFHEMFLMKIYFHSLNFIPMPALAWPLRFFFCHLIYLILPGMNQ